MCLPLQACEAVSPVTPEKELRGRACSHIRSRSARPIVPSLPKHACEAEDTVTPAVYVRSRLRCTARHCSALDALEQHFDAVHARRVSLLLGVPPVQS